MKKIILGISGSIAAYKSAQLVRLFVKSGATVRVLMTESAVGFISPLTLSTLSKNPVLTAVHAEEAWNNHVELGLWADAMVIAPATANTLAKLANGLCDNILGAVYLSARCPIFVAPAMDVDMWHHAATQANLERLLAHGAHVIPVEFGELASGLVGDGRMAEPESILAYLERFFAEGKILLGKKALVTAGPTHEALDPVRFIGNLSSGKMGIAIADALARHGAETTLVLGPTHLGPQNPSVRVIPVVSAQDMYEVCAEFFPATDIAVHAAAVADYRPKTYSTTKIKKKEDDMHLELAKTVDIAATLGQNKRSTQIVVGFALETNEEEPNALAKMKRKNMDFVVLNSLRDAGAGFGYDTNKITILRQDGSKTVYELKSKTAVAEDIVTEILLTANRSA
ncbi:MAG: bifunctional phosphopantothenoylcysteine decarboxylase/phosphopantothenate--cysteine ligase CoaBC [Saprospiraceae bacterium]